MTRAFAGDQRLTAPAHASVDSISSSSPTSKPNCDNPRPYTLARNPSSRQDIAYTYSVHWRESKTTFATRWDHYLRVFDPRIHALSLVNSVVIAFFRECR